MKNLLGNSCAKGCLVYFLALVVIVALTAVGLGGLKGKFGVNAQGTRPQVTTLAIPQTPVITIPGQGSIGVGNGPVVINIEPPILIAPTPTAAAAPPPAVAAPAAQAPAQTQALGGSISGDAVAPFYIVQPDDTLWGIARQYDVTVDALRAANSVTDNFIQAGQLLYLPQAGQTQPAPAPAPQPAPAQPAPQLNQDTGTMPDMPHTGISNTP